MGTSLESFSARTSSSDIFGGDDEDYIHMEIISTFSSSSSSSSSSSWCGEFEFQLIPIPRKHSATSSADELFFHKSGSLIPLQKLDDHFIEEETFTIFPFITTAVDQSPPDTPSPPENRDHRLVCVSSTRLCPKSTWKKIVKASASYLKSFFLLTRHHRNERSSSPISSTKTTTTLHIMNADTSARKSFSAVIRSQSEGSSLSSSFSVTSSGCNSTATLDLEGAIAHCKLSASFKTTGNY